MKRFLSVFLAALMVSSLSVTAFADGREANYDEAYYSQLKGKDISINVYNWGE